MAVAIQLSSCCHPRASHHLNSDWSRLMALRADYLCYGILATIFITSISATVATTQPANPNKADTEKLVKDFEGFRSCPYLDPVGVPTIGYGNTFYPDGRKVTMSDPCLTQDQAKKMMQAELNRTAQKVKEMVAAPMTANQKTALTSLAFNIGIEGFRQSTLLRRLNSGDKQGAAKEFDRWIHGDNKEVLPGLVDRREKEKQLFLKP